MFKFAIVGAGLIGKTHSQAVYNNPDCTLVAVADIDESKAREVAEVHGAKVYTDYKKMAEEVEMDAVIINLPHFLHCEATVYFLEKGINVLIEKPMANTVEECDKMIEASKKSGAKLAVGHVQRYFPILREVKKIIESGKYGRLSMISERRNSDYVTPERPKWFLKKEFAGGGICVNYGAHAVDRIFYTTGLSVKRVHAVLANPVSDDDVDVNVQILMELSDGVSSTVTLCGSHVPSEAETSYYFTDGTVRLIGNKLYVTEGDQLVPQEIQKGKGLIVTQLIEFIKLLKGEESEIVTPEYGREVIKVIEKITENELLN